MPIRNPLACYYLPKGHGIKWNGVKTGGPSVPAEFPSKEHPSSLLPEQIGISVLLSKPGSRYKRSRSIYCHGLDDGLACTCPGRELSLNIAKTGELASANWLL